MTVGELALFMRKEENKAMLCDTEAMILKRDVAGNKCEEQRGKEKTIDAWLCILLKLHPLLGGPGSEFKN